MKLKPWQRTSAAVVVGLALGVGFPALSAVGQSSPPASAVQLGSTATLIAKGVGVQVPVQVTCPADVFEPATLSVGLSEKAGKGIVQGGGSTSVTCTGSSQNVVVTVSAGVKAFKAGTALATASLNAFCPVENCFASASGPVHLTAK